MAREFLTIVDPRQLSPDEHQLWRAASKGDIETVRALIEKGVNIHAGKDSALRWASLSGRTEIVRFLIAAGADLHTGENAPLRCAVFQERTDTVAALLDGGANPDALNDWDWTNTDIRTLDLIKAHLRQSLDDDLSRRTSARRISQRLPRPG